MARVGVFGGSFDPPHVGHLLVARDVIEAAGLDRLHLMPAAASPHKPEGPEAPGRLRLRMLEASVREEPAMVVDRTELDRGGLSYTVDTLREMAARSLGDELCLVIGADQMAALDSWREPEEIARRARILVMARGGDEPASPPGLSVEWEPVEVRRVDVSSSEVRARVRAGRSIQFMVPEAVAAIIRDEGLYGAPETTLVEDA